MTRMRFLMMGIIIYTLAICPLAAQTASTSAITGVITDTSGSVVPAATITATNADNGQSRTVMTGADGTFNFGLLPPGTYKVTMSASGFKQEEVTVTVAVTEVADVSRCAASGSIIRVNNKY